LSWSTCLAASDSHKHKKVEGLFSSSLRLQFDYSICVLHYSKRNSKSPAQPEFGHTNPLALFVLTMSLLLKNAMTFTPFFHIRWLSYRRCLRMSRKLWGSKEARGRFCCVRIGYAFCLLLLLVLFLHFPLYLCIDMCKSFVIGFYLCLWYNMKGRIKSWIT
jgi:hypothetical protein